MTEEIIIDGVNVKDCPHRNLDCSTFMDIIKCYNYGICEGQNCLYKQLKRLEVENAMLKRHKRELGNVAQHFLKDIDRLQEKLKKIKEPYSPRLNCYTCSDTDRCNEQKEKALYPVLEIVSDIRRMVAGTEVSNNINKALDRLLSLIPSNTRCDVVLEKRLLQTEQLEQEANETVAELKAENEKLKNDSLFRIAHDNEQPQRRILEQKLEKIKEIATKYSQHEGYLLDGLFTDLVDELNGVLKDE